MSLGLVPNSRRGQLNTTGKIDAMDTTGFYFDHDANKFKINITSTKRDGGERRRDLIHLANYALEKCVLIDIALSVAKNLESQTAANFICGHGK